MNFFYIFINVLTKCNNHIKKDKNYITLDFINTNYITLTEFHNKNENNFNDIKCNKDIYEKQCI